MDISQLKIPTKQEKTDSIEKENTTSRIEPKQNKGKKSIGQNVSYATGKRKNSIARVWLKPGTGQITINNRDIIEYFPRELYRSDLLKPLVISDIAAQYDVKCTVKGGGTTGQAGAIRHGIAKAIDCISDNFHDKLKAESLLTRDSRIVERKKPGRPKARKSTQFSKR